MRIEFYGAVKGNLLSILGVFPPKQSFTSYCVHTVCVILLAVSLNTVRMLKLPFRNNPQSKNVYSVTRLFASNLLYTTKLFTSGSMESGLVSVELRVGMEIEA